VHGYWSVDLDLLVTTVQELLPELVDRLRLVMAAISTE